MVDTGGRRRIYHRSVAFSEEGAVIVTYWCGHCQDNFKVEHYGEDDKHKVGPAFGPYGALLVSEAAVEAVLLLHQRVPSEMVHDHWVCLTCGWGWPCPTAAAIADASQAALPRGRGAHWPTHEAKALRSAWEQGRDAGRIESMVDGDWMVLGKPVHTTVTHDWPEGEPDRDWRGLLDRAVKRLRHLGGPA